MIIHRIVNSIQTTIDAMAIDAIQSLRYRSIMMTTTIDAIMCRHESGRSSRSSRMMTIDGSSTSVVTTRRVRNDTGLWLIMIGTPINFKARRMFQIFEKSGPYELILVM